MKYKEIRIKSKIFDLGEGDRIEIVDVGRCYKIYFYNEEQNEKLRVKNIKKDKGYNLKVMSEWILNRIDDETMRIWKERYYNSCVAIQKMVNNKSAESYMQYLLEEICWLLEIRVPRLVFVSKKQMVERAGEDTEGLYVPTTNEIFVVKKDAYDVIDFFLLAHEARHCWQSLKYGEDFLFTEHDRKDNYEYSISPSEIDANAFATMVIQFYFEDFQLFQFEFEDVQRMYEEKYKEICELYQFKDNMAS